MRLDFANRLKLWKNHTKYFDTQVAHTGELDAAIEACTVVDKCVKVYCSSLHDHLQKGAYVCFQDLATPEKQQSLA